MGQAAVLVVHVTAMCSEGTAIVIQSATCVTTAAVTLRTSSVMVHSLTHSLTHSFLQHKHCAYINLTLCSKCNVQY